MYKSKSPENCEEVIIFKVFQILFSAYNVGIIQSDESEIDNFEFSEGTLDNVDDNFMYVSNVYDDTGDRRYYIQRYFLYLLSIG